ncbi:UNVERIFIED_CONTAM: hypothetical protein GTU68_029155 [Idotea baltica]|nr:hypothetical protein [Idotea baltica]
MQPYQVEICLDQAAYAKAAQAHGADRVELCARLDLDGITPSEELIAATRAAAPDLDLFVMIRPAGDFCYDRAAITQMLLEIEIAKSLGADGIVAGALLANGQLDIPTTQLLVDAAGPLPFTFHRAFDVCQAPMATAAQLQEMGVSRILTSGQAATAMEGKALLQQLLAEPSTPAIMAGSGVSALHIPQLWEAGVREFHFTCHRKVGKPGFDDTKVEEVMEALQDL